VGKVGENAQNFYQALKKKISEFELDDKIVFTGELEREDVLSYFSECDLFVLPSRRESFPTCIPILHMKIPMRALSTMIYV
jgi:glycosyltransferase involved in cell wall biosynthesis